MITTGQQIKNAIKWIDALKVSKGFKKTIESLGDDGSEDNNGEPTRHCCLGVGCKVTHLSDVNWRDGSDSRLIDKLGLLTDEGGFFKTSKDGENSIGFTANGAYVQTLTELNDNAYPEDDNFKNVRRFILSHLSYIFEPKVAEGLKKHFGK